MSTNPYEYRAALIVTMTLVIGACDHGPAGPDGVGGAKGQDTSVTLASLSPNVGPASGKTAVTLTGTGFQPGAVLSFGDVRAVARVSGSTRIVTEAPPHGAGIVDVLVINPDGRQARLANGFTYVFVADAPPPVVSGLANDVGSTEGGAVVAISGTGFVSGATVTLAGIPVGFGAGSRAFLYEGNLLIDIPPHAAGRVALVVTNPDGQRVTVPDAYTYVLPGDIDFNGFWQGGSGPGDGDITPVQFTIRDNAVVSALCGGVPVPLPNPLPVVSEGKFVIRDGLTVLMTGRVVSPVYALGQMSVAQCAADGWGAHKRTP